MIGKSEKKGLTDGSSIRFNPSKSATEVEKKPKKLGKAATDDGEKPHKSSVSKAERKARRMKDKMPSDQEVLDAIPTLAPDSQEKKHLDEYLHMFHRLQKLIRKCEKQCLEPGKRADQRDLYALCTLYSQQREVIADIRSVSDMSSQVATMESTVVRPMISTIGQNVLDTMFQIKKIIMECSAPEKTQAALVLLERVTAEQGKFLQYQYGVANEKVSSILLG